MAMASSPPHSDPTEDLVRRLRAAGCVFAEEEVALLEAAAPSQGELERMTSLREGGTPVELVLGWAAFCGLRIRVAPTVFVPRRRTELLVRTALELLGPESLVLDLGCGTGAIAAALLKAQPTLEIHAVDIDPAAVACAGRNLDPDRVHLGDLYAPLPTHLRGRVDLIVANVPYVPTAAIATMPREARDHESRTALDGGVDGLDVQRRVIAGASTWLGAGGRLLMETSPAQSDRTRAEMRAAGLTSEVICDRDLEANLAVGFW